LLLLSGGSAIAVAAQACQILEKKGAALAHCTVRLADERWGEAGHADSNQVALEEAGVIDCVEASGATWADMLPSTAVSPELHAATLSHEYAAAAEHATFLLAGMGADAHTAGILPTTDSTLQKNLLSTDHSVVFYELPEEYTGNPFHRRLTITPRFIASCSEVLLFATGAAKRPALLQLIAQQAPPTTSELAQAPVLCLRNAAQLQIVTDQQLAGR